MTLVFEPQGATLASTTDGRLFPVRRVFCVARNYAAHAREMGRNPDTEPPFFFTKWGEAVVPSGTAIPYPSETSDYQFEAELVVAIGVGGSNIERSTALGHVFGYAAGLDMTRRDLQTEAKKLSRPWDTGKNFEASAPLGPISPADAIGHRAAGAIMLTVDGQMRQSGDLADMIWPVEDIIAHISRFYRLEPGDLIYTGTPAGVGAVVAGNKIEVRIDGLEPLAITIT